MSNFAESIIEQASIDWLSELGCSYSFGPDLAFDGSSPERTDYFEPLLLGRLENAITRLNPSIPPQAQADAFRQVTRLTQPSLLLCNHTFHDLLINGIVVEYKLPDGRTRNDRVYLVDFEHPENNDFLVVNQYTVEAQTHNGTVNRRPDLVVFVNGLPLAVIELKNAADENATIWSAFNQLQTYKKDIPRLFHYNELLIISDGLNARFGSLTSNKEWFLPWKTIEGDTTAPASVTQLEVLLKGIFDKRRFLDLIRYFIVFEQERGAPTLKKIAGYHQFHAVNYAVAETVRATYHPTAPVGPVGAGLRPAPGGPAQVNDIKGLYLAESMRGGATGDHRIGVIWHTQGSGKSLTMAFYTGRLVVHPQMHNPTIIVLTDRNDLDDQLFGTFSRCQEILRQAPEQAESREDLRDKLKDRLAGGIFFTTIQKFMPTTSLPRLERSSPGEEREGEARTSAPPSFSGKGAGGLGPDGEDSLHLLELAPANEGRSSPGEGREGEVRTPAPPSFSGKGVGGLGPDGDERLPSPGASFPRRGAGGEAVLSDRHNIVVIADEAHRSQYDFIDGYARHMRDALPNASFIGFTGTPIELTDANTRAVFGDYISIYDIQQAVEDGATVKILYEGRLAKLELDEQEKPKVDPEFDEITEGEELEQKEKLKTKWAALEAIVGADKRVGLVARDFIAHFEERLNVMDGKAMIVCMSRRIAVDMYNAIVKLRPEWHSHDDKKGVVKIVMTGSATDPLEWSDHIRNKFRREELAKRFKDPNDPFKVVIVRDMWLTGFDVPPLHTMYIDKPMQGHGLMQSIARVNRVYKDKPGGLIVDYLGLAYHLQKALANYTSAGHPAEIPDQDQAVNELLRRYEICKGLFHGFDWSLFIHGTPQQRLGIYPLAMEHILKQKDGKSRYLAAVRGLSLAFALAVPDERALAIRDDVAFFQAVRAALIKTSGDTGQSAEDIDQAIRQILSRAVAASDQVIDIFSAAGLKKPDISILSEEFLADVKDMPQKNLAIELLRKLLNDEIKTRMKTNLIQSRSFLQMLERTINSYQNRTLDSAEIIAELVKLAQEMREAQKRGEQLHLSDDEIAFYDALEVNDSAVMVLGDETLKNIARELVETVRNNATIDWTVRETVRAKLRVMVKRILRKYGYPPDKQEKATTTVLEQAEMIARDWAG